jgi:ATP:ADP antiporter, AAA family
MSGPATPGEHPKPAVSRAQMRLRIIGLSVMAFFLMGSYSLARSTTESLFIEAHTSKGLPLVWILVSLGMLASVVVYTHFVPRFELMNLFGVVTFISTGIVVAILLGRGAELKWMHHLLYVWKDTYMVVLVEIYYSFANSAFTIQTARWVYGLFGILGGLGAIVGNMAVRQLAPQIGTVTTIWLVVPMLLALGVGGMALGRAAGVNNPLKGAANQPGVVDAVRVAARSSYLLLVLLLIALTQSAITLIDFSFNEIVEVLYPETDARTALVSTVYAAISTGMLLLHGSTGPLLRLAGVPLVLLGIPVIMGGGVTVFTLAPALATVLVIKVGSKCFDYTLFRNAKEILYIPLSYQERTQGKSLVDMLTYRVAKGLASAMLAGALATGIPNIANYLTLTLIGGWFLVTLLVTRRFRQKVSREEEIKGKEAT